MKLKLRKRTKNNLRKLVKVDETGNSLFVDPVYVRVEDVEGNVVEEGTPITAEVLESINWKDENGIEFLPLSSNDLPSAKENVIQIVSKINGEVWCIPQIGGKEAFPLGNANFDNLIKKNEDNYIQGRTFEFFILDKEGKFFGTRMRIGAIPVRDVESKSMDGGTYIDMNNTGNIVMFINGLKAHEFSVDGVSLSNQQSTFVIDKNGSIKLETTLPNTLIQVKGQSFKISSPKTKIGEANNQEGQIAKFNCHSELDEASYGNKSVRLQFYPTFVRFRDVANNKDILQIDLDGTIHVNNIAIPGNYKVVDENSFKELFKTEFNKYSNRKVLFIGATSELYSNYTDSNSVYMIEFSLTEASDKMNTMVFSGSDLTGGIVFTDHDNNNYLLYQYVASDDQEDDYFQIQLVDNNGLYKGDAYIRAVYLIR